MSTRSRTKTGTNLLVVALLSAVLPGCVFRIDIQQGNVLEQENIEQVAVGMSRSAVQFLLGTPLVEDSFHRDRWDYAYYLQRGRSRQVSQAWMVVYFEGDRVVRIDRDVQLEPARR